MAGSLLLDTNVVVALLAGDPETRDFLSQAEMTFLPSIVLGELYYGAWKSRQMELQPITLCFYINLLVTVTKPNANASIDSGVLGLNHTVLTSTPLSLSLPRISSALGSKRV